MKRILIALTAIGFAACGAFAEEVTADMAMYAADQWVSKNPGFKAGGKALSVITVCDTNAAATVLWHQVKMSGDGMLVMAPVTEIEPVIAALDNNPGELPANHPLRDILTKDIRARLRFLGLYREDSKGPRLTAAAPAPTGNAAVVAGEWADQQESKWAKLGVITERGARLMESERTGVSDIALEIGIVPGFEKGGCLTHWNQSNAGGGKCFNYYTPNNSVCGCVATALASVLQFFKVTGVATESGSPYEGSCTYNGVAYDKAPASVRKDGSTSGKAKTLLRDDSGAIVSEEDGTGSSVYNWALLPSNWGGEAAEADTLTDEQRQVLGQVAFDAGVTVDMMWSDGESGAITLKDGAALRDVFGFADARVVSSPGQEHYKKLICLQNQCGVPVLMSIEGHAVVAVGYGRDADGVDRTRVFLGWGGSGDGWYALPYIDTKSTLAGSTYLSEVINGVITMLSYSPDGPDAAGGTVPVCGRLIPTMNAEVTADGVSTNANSSGFFGLRVPVGGASRTVIVACPSEDKSSTVTVGKDCDPSTGGLKYTYSASALCEMIPDDIVLLLVNSLSAASYSDAVDKAKKNNLPILFFCGTSGDAAADATWDIIKNLDDTNGAGNPNFADGFTNKFVIAYFPFRATDPISDVNPSYGVFSPTAIDEVNRWTWYNSRLTYNDLSFFETNIVGTATNYVALAETTNAVMTVLTEGMKMFAEKDAAITIKIKDESLDGLSFADRELSSFKNGQTPAFAVADTVTSEEDGYKYASAGCVLYKKTGVDAKGNDIFTPFLTGTVANVTMPALQTNTTYLIEWQWDVTHARVRAYVDADDKKGKAGEVDFTTGWVEYGSDVSVSAVATPTATKPWVFKSWKVAPEWSDGFEYPADSYPVAFENYYRYLLAEDLGVTEEEVPYASYAFGGTSVADGSCITVTVYEPIDLVAHFGQTGDAGIPVSYDYYSFKTTADPTTLMAELAEPVPVRLATVAIPYNVATNIFGGPMTISVSSTNFIDSVGTNWVCTGWTLRTNNVVAATGVAPRASFTLEGAAELIWKWEKVTPTGLLPANVPFSSNGTSSMQVSDTSASVNIVNTVAGWWYGLYSTTDLVNGPWTCMHAEQAKADNEVIDFEVDLSSFAVPQMFFKVIVTADDPQN